MYEMKTVSLTDLKPHPKNPRVHPEKMLKKLCNSIQEFGFTSPVLVDADYRILAGHARCKAAEKLNITEVPVVILPLSGVAADAYVIADNKLNELSEWDENILADLIADIDSANFDVELTGFDADEIDALLSPKGCKEDDFDEEKAKKDVEDNGGAITREGDIWLLGEHKLICGDSTLLETFDKLLEGLKAQLCITSPPYSVGKNYETDSIDDWFATTRPAIKNICRNADNVCYNIGDKMNTQSQFIEPTFAYSVEMFADNGFRPLFIKVWHKQRMALSSTAPIHLSTLKGVGDSEYLAAFSGGMSHTDNPQQSEEFDLSEHSFITGFGNSNYKLVKRLSKQERREFGYSSVWTFPSVQGGKTNDRLSENNHKARFPVTLPWRCAKMLSDPNNIILEPFSGTFTTGIACEQLGRKCYAIERDPTYCDISVARYRKFAPDTQISLLRDGRIIPIEETGVLV
jgi:DNA modification methylase